MVRIPNGAGPGVDRLVVAYNDFTGTTEVLDGGANQIRQGASRHGWAYSDNLGVTWHAQSQVSVPVADGGVQLVGRGDPYLAVVNGMVLYVAMASEAPVGQITDLVLARLPFGSTTFEPAQSIARLAPGESAFDGPKIATTDSIGANALAIVTWTHATTIGVGYTVLSNLDAMPSVTVGPLRHFSFPPIRMTQLGAGGACAGVDTGASADLEGHPVVGVGLSGFAYVGVQSGFTVGACHERRLEVYRSELQAAGIQTWARILSRPSVGSLGTFVSGSGIQSRPGQWGSMGVSRRSNYDVVTLAATNYVAGIPGEMQHQSVRMLRVPAASSCLLLGGEEGCLADPADDFEPELSFRIKTDYLSQPVALHANRLGVNRLQPAIVSSPRDSRLAVFWYAQPYRWINELPMNTQRYWTTVEGVQSTNAGENFGPIRRLAIEPAGALVNFDSGESIGLGTETVNAINAGAGMMFEPCLSLVRANEYYFGDYISGTFLRDWQPGDSTLYPVYGTWSDSRNGCPQPPTAVQSPVYHQHVFGGAW